MSEDTLSDQPAPHPSSPAEAPPPEPGAAGAPHEPLRARPRPRGGRGRKGGPEFAGAEGDEPAGEEMSAVQGPEPAAPAAPADAPATRQPPAEVAGAGPPEARPPRDPRDPRELRRDGRPPRPDQRPPRPDPRDQRREPRPPRPEHREPRYEPRPPRPERPERPDRTPLDPNEVSDMAWQLFFGELREEGLALVDDADAEKLTNRCFRLAEIFLRTRQRRMNQLFAGGTTINDDRPRDEPRLPQAPRPKPEVPIENRLPDDPSRLSKGEAEALIEEAQEAAAAKPAGAAVASAEEGSVGQAAHPTGAAPPAEPPSADDGGD